MFDCFGCGQRYDFLRGVALPGPATFCHKCEKRREAGLTDDEVAIAAAKVSEHSARFLVVLNINILRTLLHVHAVE